MAREVSGRDDMRFALCGENDTIYFLRKYIMSEAFIYLWYDAPNKKYYLGKHKGSPDDKYTHSSTVWERFTKDNIPEGVTRRILAYGTDKEMCVLEHELLVNRKKRCWNRYYNNSLGDPRYIDQSGKNHHYYGVAKEDHPLYGRSLSEETKRKLSIAATGRKLTEETKKKIGENQPDVSGENNPMWKGGVTNDKEYQLKKQRERYWKNPEESRKKTAAKMRKLRAKWKQDPAWQKKINKQDRERRARKKAERQGVGTLDAFLK
tara:strand:- start:213 stop:1001 length:789 start_codon:yes stop_codon:yes gene_type:complete